MIAVQNWVFVKEMTPFRGGVGIQIGFANASKLIIRHDCELRGKALAAALISVAISGSLHATYYRSKYKKQYQQ